MVAVAPSLDPAWMESRVAKCYVGRAPLRTLTDSTPEALRYADLGIVSSGTATVVAALLECPMIVVYRVAPFSWFMGKFLVDVPFYSMVNLLAKKPVVPEMIQDTEAWQAQPWYAHYTAAAQGTKTILFHVRPRSYALVFPPTLE